MLYLSLHKDENLLGSPETMKVMAETNMKDWIGQHTKKLSPFVESLYRSNLYESYINIMLSDGHEYGSILELYLYAHMRGVNIVVYSVNDFQLPREVNNGIDNRPCQTSQFEVTGCSKTIALWFTGDHYM